MTTAILSALPEEQSSLVPHLARPQRVMHAGRAFWLGDLQGRGVVLALSGIGKVAAATTATALIERFGVARVVFTGVAGGVGDGVNVGDDKEVKKWMKKHPEVLQGGETVKVETVRREEPKVGRNDPCTCGSGKKYKKCCGQGK